MSVKAKASYHKPSGAELRALREQRAAGPTSEAARREASFLRNIAGAGDDLEWILLNQAWTQLDFERVGDWWEQRVLPVLEKLDLRPSVQLAERVIAAIQADEQVLPRVQRRTQREIASIAKTSQSRVSRLLADSPASGSDLGGPAKADGSQPAPAPADIPAALREAIAETAGSVGTGVAYAARPRPTVLCPVPRDLDNCNVCGERLPERGAGYLRCEEHDRKQEHIAWPTDGGLWLECRICYPPSKDGIQDTAAVTAESPTEPVYAGLGGEPVGPDQAAGSAGITSPGDDTAPVGDAAETSPEPEIPSTGGGSDGRRVADSPAAAPAGHEDTPAVADQPTSPHAGVPAAGGTSEERIEEEAVEPPVDSPIGRDHIEARTPEIAVATTGRSGEYHHLSGGVAREDAGPSLAEPVELEDGGTPIPPSSSDELLDAFAGLVLHLSRADVDALAPLVLDEEVTLLLQHADDIQEFVTRLIRARTAS